MQSENWTSRIAISQCMRNRPGFNLQQIVVAELCQMLWNHPYTGPYAFAEWLLSIAFCLSILALIGAWAIAWLGQYRRNSTRRDDRS